MVTRAGITAACGWAWLPHVRKWSGKSQGILKIDVCGNHGGMLDHHRLPRVLDDLLPGNTSHDEVGTCTVIIHVRGYMYQFRFFKGCHIGAGNLIFEWLLKQEYM